MLTKQFSSQIPSTQVGPIFCGTECPEGKPIATYQLFRPGLPNHQEGGTNSNADPADGKLFGTTKVPRRLVCLREGWRLIIVFVCQWWPGRKGEGASGKVQLRWTAREWGKRVLTDV